MRTRGTLVALVLLAALFALGVVLEWKTSPVSSPPDSPSSAIDEGFVRRETRPTLAPARFSGTAAQAYDIAGIRVALERRYH